MDETLHYGTDTKYFLNICQHFIGAFINKRLVQIRRHERSTTENYYTTDVFIDSINIATTIYKTGSISRTEYQRILGHYYYKMGVAELLSLKRPKEAMLSFFSCIRFTPLSWKSYMRLFQALLFFVKLNMRMKQSQKN